MSNFRYSRLIEVKEILLDQKQQALEATLSEIGGLTAELREVELQIGATYDQMGARCLYGKELSTMIDHVGFLDRKKALLMSDRAKARSHAETLRKELMDLEIDLKMFEKLETKLIKTANKIQSKKDQKLMDELALRVERQ
jgi:flagellar export protein FliJ